MTKQEDAYGALLEELQGDEIARVIAYRLNQVHAEVKTVANAARVFLILTMLGIIVGLFAVAGSH